MRLGCKTVHLHFRIREASFMNCL